jgi:hypothetical protein
MEIDLPIEEPLDLHRAPYGGAVSAVCVLLILCGIGFFGWAVYQYITVQALEIPALIAAVECFAVSALCPPLKKLIHDMEELKKRFR